MGWATCYENVLPYVFAIETPEGAGSGVFFMYNDTKTYAAVATAAHVVDHADTWKLPIKLRNHNTGKELFLKDDDRVLFVDRRRDTAAIMFLASLLELPQEVLPLMAANKYKPIGTEIAWVGYPSIAHPNLCFFSGRVSAFLMSDDSYLIDGVAINGVSGGPVFSLSDKDQPMLLGTVSAYMPNRIRGDALPGLLRVQDVTTFHETINTVKSIDDARKKKREEEEARKLQEQQSQSGSDAPASATPADGAQPAEGAKPA